MFMSVTAIRDGAGDCSVGLTAPGVLVVLIGPPRLAWAGLGLVKAYLADWMSFQHISITLWVKPRGVTKFYKKGE